MPVRPDLTAKSRRMVYAHDSTDFMISHDQELTTNDAELGGDKEEDVQVLLEARLVPF